MSSIRDLHRQAMDIAELAFVARLHGEIERAKELAREALQYEADAAHLVADRIDAEPTRSVLHRSAASLALQCGDYQEAVRLIAVGLSGNPPGEIANELKELLEQVSFQQYLDLHGTSLAPSEFQLRLSGGAIGPGLAPNDRVVEILQSLERLFHRTLQRMGGIPYTESYTTAKLAKDYTLYVSAPMTGSFIVNLRFGRPEQPTLPGFDLSTDVLNELLQCVELLNNDENEQLQEKISDPAYYRNFVGLVRKLAPDGDDISRVSLSTTRNSSERTVSLTRKRVDISLDIAKPRRTPKPVVTHTGSLLFADSTKTNKGEIGLVDDEGVRHTIIVPLGMMTDIVKPLWEERVTVTGVESGKKIVLHDIVLAT